MPHRNKLVNGPDPIDVHVGKRLRLRRIMVGMSQEDVALSQKITFQQIQKYERGANRISASRLHMLATALNCKVGFFFDGLDECEVSPRQTDRFSLTTLRMLSEMDERERAGVVGLLKGLKRVSADPQAAE